MTLHNNVDTVAFVTDGIYSETYGPTTIRNLVNLLASEGLLEVVPTVPTAYIERISVESEIPLSLALRSEIMRELTLNSEIPLSLNLRSQIARELGLDSELITQILLKSKYNLGDEN